MMPPADEQHIDFFVSAACTDIAPIDTASPSSAVFSFFNIQ